MSEHKTTLITGSKLTNYASFLFLAAEVGGGLLVLLTEEPSALVCITWIWHREVLCEAVQGEMDLRLRVLAQMQRESPGKAHGRVKLENTNEL